MSVTIVWTQVQIGPGVFADCCPVCGCIVVMELKRRHEDWHNDLPVRDLGA